jgi:hypothetical protein
MALETSFADKINATVVITSNKQHWGSGLPRAVLVMTLQYLAAIHHSPNITREHNASNHDIWSVSGVCHEWYTTVMTSPSLWYVLIANHRLTNPSSPSHDRHLTIDGPFIEFIKCRGGYLTHIDMSYTSITNDAITALVAYCPRVTSLLVGFSSHVWSPVSEMTTNDR